MSEFSMTGGSSGSSVLGYDSSLLQASNFPPQLTPFYYDAIQPIRETPPVLSPEYEADSEKSSPSYWETIPLKKRLSHYFSHLCASTSTDSNLSQREKVVCKKSMSYFSTLDDNKQVHYQSSCIVPRYDHENKESYPSEWSKVPLKKRMSFRSAQANSTEAHHSSSFMINNFDSTANLSATSGWDNLPPKKTF